MLLKVKKCPHGHGWSLVCACVPCPSMSERSGLRVGRGRWARACQRPRGLPHSGQRPRARSLDRRQPWARHAARRLPRRRARSRRGTRRREGDVVKLGPTELLGGRVLVGRLELASRGGHAAAVEQAGAAAVVAGQRSLEESADGVEHLLHRRHARLPAARRAPFLVAVGASGRLGRGGRGGRRHGRRQRRRRLGEHAAVGQRREHGAHVGFLVVARAGHLRELACEALPSLEHDLHERARVLGLLALVHEGVRDALGARAARPPDPVDVVLDVAREVVVDDGLHLLDVDPARGDVGRDEHGAAARLELGEAHLALALVLVAVDHAHADVAQLHAELVAHALGRREHHHARARLQGGEDGVEELLLIGGRADHVHVLRDVLVRVQRVDVAHLHLHRLPQEFVRERAHLARPRRRVEESLPVGADAAADDLADLRLEAHVEHAVRLVHHEVGHLAELDLAALAEVVHAAGRADDARAALPHRLHLLALRRAAVAADGADAERPAKRLRLDVDLHRELARGREHEDGWPHHRVGLERHDVEEPGHQEAERLARAGLGDADYVAFRHRRRPRLRLDDGRCREALRGDGRHHLRG
mmetsp:Transcript_26660/g.71289  ORF Transcript_26660/g.71289 Transcript_26660/m.71289 type:complete len:591 (-) Transcript_26660:404-2176(-)